MIQFSLTKKFFNFFTKKEKLFFFVIIFLQFLCMVLELVSIGLYFQFLNQSQIQLE